LPALPQVLYRQRMDSHMAVRRLDMNLYPDTRYSLSVRRMANKVATKPVDRTVDEWVAVCAVL
jgi:hypothetical protein